MVGVIVAFGLLNFAASKLVIGGGVFVPVDDIPHYLGTEQSEQYIMPVPHVRYQSDKLDLNHADNQARAGMDFLDWVFEFLGLY